MQLDLLGGRRPTPLHRSRGGRSHSHLAASPRCTPPASTAPTRSRTSGSLRQRASSCQQSVIFTAPFIFSRICTFPPFFLASPQDHAAARIAERHSPANLLGLSISRQHQPQLGHSKSISNSLRSCILTHPHPSGPCTRIRARTSSRAYFFHCLCLTFYMNCIFVSLHYFSPLHCQLLSQARVRFGRPAASSWN